MLPSDKHAEQSNRYLLALCSYYITVHTVFQPIYSHLVRIYRLKGKTVPYIKN